MLSEPPRIIRSSTDVERITSLECTYPSINGPEGLGLRPRICIRAGGGHIVGGGGSYTWGQDTPGQKYGGKRCGESKLLHRLHSHAHRIFLPDRSLENIRVRSYAR